MRNYSESSQETQTSENEFLEKPDFETLPTTENLNQQVKEIQRIVRLNSQRFIFFFFEYFFNIKN